MGGGLIVELPWPVREVWPNYRQSHHWRKFHTARKAQRDHTHLWARACLNKWSAEAPSNLSMSFAEMMLSKDRIPLNVEFYPPDRRRRDDDGCIGAFKSARDGIADALGVDDWTRIGLRIMQEQAPLPADLAALI